MTSPAKIAAAIRNAQKSTGPKTQEGKRKSRVNAIKHGLTAKIVLLPEENAAEFKQLMVGWFDAKKPQDQSEASLVERAAYTLWQIDRVNRAQSARLWLRADGHADDEATRAEQEVAELACRLFRAPYGRPAALPCAQGTGTDPDGDSTRVGMIDREEGRRAEDGGRRIEGKSAFAGTIDSDDHPAKVISRMASTAFGCRWLLELWSELQTSLDRAGWRTAERFRAFRLMGIHPSNTYMNRELASIIQACQAIDPDAGSLVGEVWNELVPKDLLPALEAQYQREVAHLPALDQDGARKCLLTRIEQETTLIEEKLKRHEERAEAQQELSFHQLAFDDSREGRLLQRYEHSCKQFFLRCLDELRDHREESAARAKQGLGGWYIRPREEWFETGPSTKAQGVNPKSQNPNSKGGEELGAVAGNGAEISSAIDVEQVADLHACRSESGEREREDSLESIGEEVDGALTCGAEPSSDIDTVRCAERDERTAMEIASLAEGARRWEAQTVARGPGRGERGSRARDEWNDDVEQGTEAQAEGGKTADAGFARGPKSVINCLKSECPLDCRDAAGEGTVGTWRRAKTSLPICSSG